MCERLHMSKPSLKTVTDLAGISKGYASDILNHKQAPSRPLAVLLYRHTGWKHPCIAELSDEQLVASELLEPWTRPAERKQVAA